MNEPTNQPPEQILLSLTEQYPDSPFLALGQTVFWDEPVKAVLRRLLDAVSPEAKMCIGVHDTDYFAKTPLRQAGGGRFVLMPHNDGSTKTLWSAAGEISALFGSETFPSRHDFLKFGVPFDRIAKAAPEGKDKFHDANTEAWGWRGLVYTGSRDLIVSSLCLREVGDGVLEMLRWGFSNTVRRIRPSCCEQKAQAFTEKMLGWCQKYIEEHPEKSLSDLFTHCLPQLYRLLLGEEPKNTEVTSTTNLLNFTTQTACLPRFRFVNLFLDPATREIAINAYNKAVTGSEIYTLDKFGAGSLPFDIIVPGRGRGTLRVTPRVVFIETRQPIAIGLKQPITSIEELAALLERKLGNQLTLVGKAVSLVSMLSQEFIFVFNEHGSMYVHRTRKMNDYLRQHGVELDMRPILRMRYHTWDAMTAVESRLALPEHLRASFHTGEIEASEFGNRWRDVIDEQNSLLQHIATLRKPIELLDCLMEVHPSEPWQELLDEYIHHRTRLVELYGEASERQLRLNATHTKLRTLKQEEQLLQQERGDHFRRTEDWTDAEEHRRDAFANRIAEIQEEKQVLKSRLILLRAEISQVLRGSEAKVIRTRLHDIEIEAETARLKIVRNAYLTIEGLSHTSYRPSAWWIPALDRTGNLFKQLVATTELYLEPLLT